jgi:DNA-binding transcriptional regulator YhcF (GntR family)
MTVKLDFNNDKSIYLQIAENIEDDILHGTIEEEQQLPSTNEMAVIFKINPATAGKGVNLLVEDNIVYKKRGIGMFVAQGATTQIKKKRRRGFYENYLYKLLDEAKSIGITRDELVEMIQSGGENNE